MQCLDVLLFIFSKELKVITISLWMLGMTRRCISGDRRGWKMWFTGNVLFMSHSSLYWLTLAAWEGAAVYFQPLSILFIAIVPTILLDSTHREPEQWLSSELPGAEWGTSVGRSCFQLRAELILLLIRSFHCTLLAYFELWGRAFALDLYDMCIWDEILNFFLHPLPFTSLRAFKPKARLMQDPALNPVLLGSFVQSHFGGITLQYKLFTKMC